MGVKPLNLFSRGCKFFLQGLPQVHQTPVWAEQVAERFQLQQCEGGGRSFDQRPFIAPAGTATLVYIGEGYRETTSMNYKI